MSMKSCYITFIHIYIHNIQVSTEIHLYILAIDISLMWNTDSPHFLFMSITFKNEIKIMLKRIILSHKTNDLIAFSMIYKVKKLLSSFFVLALNLFYLLRLSLDVIFQSFKLPFPLISIVFFTLIFYSTYSLYHLSILRLLL